MPVKSSTNKPTNVIPFMEEDERAKIKAIRDFAGTKKNGITTDIMMAIKGNAKVTVTKYPYETGKKNDEEIQLIHIQVK